MAMEIKDLWPAVFFIILIAMLVAVGLILLDKTADVSRATTGVADEIISLSSGTATLANTPLVAMVNVGNLTGEVIVDTSRADFNFTASSGLIKLNASYDIEPNLYVNYTYGADVDATTGINDSITAIKAISSTWMALLVTIIVLAIVLGLIMSSFVTGRR